MKSPSEPKATRTKTARRIFIAHDNAMVRQGIRFLIDQQEDLEVCGEAEEGAAALGLVLRSAPEAVIVDVVSEHGSGLKLIRGIHSGLPDAAILVVTMQDERVYGERCLRAGASGYVMKAPAIEEVIRALRVVLRGRIYLSDNLADCILSRRIVGQDAAGGDPMSRLSDRELEIFTLIGTWKRTREIAEMLHLSVKTVEYYREQIKKKLELGNAADLVQAATEWVKEGAGNQTAKK